VAVWRVQSDRAVRKTLEGRATVVAELNDARAEFFLNINLLTTGILGGDPAPFAEEYRQRRLLAAESIATARAELAALNETEEIATLDTIGDSIEGMLQDIDAGMDIAVNLDQETIIQMAPEYERDMWPRIESILADIEQLGRDERAKLASDRAAADGASETTLSLLIGLGVAAFLLASATLAMFLTSLLRPLASLQASARAITSGNWEARAKVSGPEETASLAQDFNQMITERKEAEEALRKRTHDLGERAKELNCLYGISNLVQRPDISLEEILQGTGNFIPPAWQYPEITCARIVLGGQEYLTDNFRETAWRQTSDIIVNGERTGAVEVCYLEEKPESDDGPFLTEERGLINAIAERLGRVSERRRAEQALRESEERYRSIFESIQDVFYRTDAEGIITEISPSIERFGFTREALIGTQVLEVYEDPEERSGLLKALLEQGDVADHEIRLKTGDGRLINTSVSAHILRGPDGTLSGVEGTLRDITQRKQAEEKLEIFSNAVEGAYDSFVMVDMNGNVIYANESAIKTFDYSPEEIMKLNVAQLTANPEDAMKVIKEVETKRSYNGELICIGKKKEAIPILLSVSILKDNKGNPTGMMGVFRDITERKRAEEALHELSRRDPLTGVLNHGAIVDEMRSLISTGEDATPWAVAMIDVDRLKVMNDTYGHQAGDAMLVAVATALSRDDALVGRYGGDEFVAILPSADRNAAERYRKDTTDALAHATITDPQTGASVRAEASIGLAVYPEDGSTLADLIKFSDSTMYAVKRRRPVRRPSPHKHAPDRKAA